MSKMQYRGVRYQRTQMTDKVVTPDAVMTYRGVVYDLSSRDQIIRRPKSAPMIYRGWHHGALHGSALDQKWSVLLQTLFSFLNPAKQRPVEVGHE